MVTTVMYSALQRTFNIFLCLQMSKKPSFSDCKKDIILEAYVLRYIEHFALTMKLQQAFITGITLSISEDVYNIFRKVFERVFKRHDDQKASVKLWLNGLETRNYNVYIDNDDDSSFTFGFCSA